MGLKIGITGTAKGFGQFLNQSIHSEEMNGWDYDIVINNEQDGYKQLDIAITCYKLGIPVINIGSLITEADVEPIDRNKKHAKVLLKEFSERYGQSYLTWGFKEGHKYLRKNPELETFVTIWDAIDDVKRELAAIQSNL